MLTNYYVLGSASPGSRIPLTPTRHKTLEETGVGMYIAKHFCGDLVEEIHGLRSIIDQLADGDENHDNNLHSGQHPHHSISSSIIGIGASHTGAMRFFVSGFLVFRPVSTTCRWLCQVHIRQKHPIIKALHGPPLSRFMLDGLLLVLTIG